MFQICLWIPTTFFLVDINSEPRQCDFTKRHIRKLDSAASSARLWEKSLTNISASTAEHRRRFRREREGEKKSFFWFLNTPVRVREGSGEKDRGNIFPLLKRALLLRPHFYRHAFIYSFACSHSLVTVHSWKCEKKIEDSVASTFQSDLADGAAENSKFSTTQSKLKSDTLRLITWIYNLITNNTQNVLTMQRFTPRSSLTGVLGEPTIYLMWFSTYHINHS